MSETAEVAAALRRMGLLGRAEEARFERLTGGVSSDIWKVEARESAFCVKRALPKLRVEQDWRAPVSRNAYEVAWMEVANRAAPGSTPRLLGHDPEAGLFAMTYLEPAAHPLWKALLRDGVAETAHAEAVATRLVAIHAATANDAAVAARFPTDEIFHAIRLEPYLEATARAHPDLAEPLYALVRRTAATRRTLVHGDVSPKNILAGPQGPVFLDAECAWYGDPAFDLAFCLNHLLLKCHWNPAAVPGYLECFDALHESYSRRMTDVAPRAATLLPALLLARVDGKSPVEYLAEEGQKARVREAAIALLERPAKTLQDVKDAWRESLT